MKVIVVGQIQSLHEVSGKTSFMINDGTSSIDAIIWDEQEESSQKQWRRFSRDTNFFYPSHVFLSEKDAMFGSLECCKSLTIK